MSEMPTVDIDNKATYGTTDPSGMLDRIHELPEQLTNAWTMVEQLQLPQDYRNVKNVVVLGMGGSAIGADLVRTLVAGECPVPIIVNRDYALPAFVNQETLVVASSYSGNTEETLTALDHAQHRKARIVSITTGGKLAEWSRGLGIPTFTYFYEAQPRAAIGYSFVPLLGILEKAGLIGNKGRQIAEARQEMESLALRIGEKVPVERNPAKQLAQKLHGKIVVVYGADLLTEVARRWKGQVNENAKTWAFFEAMPELNHNAVVGLEHPEQLGDKIIVVMLVSSFNEPRNLTRFEVTDSILAKQNIAHALVEAAGRTPMAQMMSLITFGDYVSYYLALLYQQDPTPVDVISYLKGELAKRD
jgi:glucose/mannose-6-phosphate isomerase